MKEIIDTVRKDLHEAIRTNQLVLPTLPEVALKVREAASDANINAAKLTKEIVTDAALTARIIKVANSPLLRGSHTIDDLKMAISRLGIDYTCNLATSLAMQQMFQATSDEVDKRLREVWSHSAEVAGISHVLARQYARLKPDEATLAGVVHQIGILPILTYAEEHRILLKKPQLLDAIIERLHPELGRQILEAWEFPPALAIVPEEHLNFERQVPRADFADVVMVANLQCYAGTDHPLANVDTSNISAFERMGLSPNFEEEEEEDLTANMEAAMAMLK